MNLTGEQQTIILKGLQTQYDQNFGLISDLTKKLNNLKSDFSISQNLELIKKLERENELIEKTFKMIKNI